MRQNIVYFTLFTLSLFLFFSGCQSTKIPKKHRPKVIVTSKIKKERAWIEKIYSDSNALLTSLSSNTSHSLSWRQLRKQMRLKAKRGRFSRNSIKAAGQMIDFFEKRSDRLMVLYDFKFEWRDTSLPSTVGFVRLKNILLPAEEYSMWRHCKAKVENSNPKLKFKLKSAYQSPAYQLISFVKASRRLPKALKLESPPNYSGHQTSLPLFAATDSKEKQHR